MSILQSTTNQYAASAWKLQRQFAEMFYISLTSWKKKFMHFYSYHVFTVHTSPITVIEIDRWAFIKSKLIINHARNVFETSEFEVCDKFL